MTTFISRVVEERVLVQVRRADREPAVVDDADLRVDVDRLAAPSPACVERAREEAAGAVVGLDQHAELAARVVGAVVRLRGQHDDEAELVVGGLRSLSREDLDDLGRPEELVLEVDEPLAPSAARAR